MTYQIRIAVDPNGNRRVAAWEWPPEKTLLKRGDKLPFSFVNQHQHIHFKWKGNSDNLSEVEEAYQEHLKNITQRQFDKSDMSGFAMVSAPKKALENRRFVRISRGFRPSLPLYPTYSFIFKLTLLYQKSSD